MIWSNASPRASRSSISARSSGQLYDPGLSGSGGCTARRTRCEVGVDGEAAKTGQPARRRPDLHEREGEVASAPLEAKLPAGVPGAQPHVLAVADVQLARQPARPIETHGTHRTLPSVPRLVERDRHDPIVPHRPATSPLRTVPTSDRTVTPSQRTVTPRSRTSRLCDAIRAGRVARGGGRPIGHSRRGRATALAYVLVVGAGVNGGHDRLLERRLPSKGSTGVDREAGQQGDASIDPDDAVAIRLAGTRCQANPMSDWSTAAPSRATHWRRCTLGRTIRPSLQEDKNSVTSELARDRSRRQRQRRSRPSPRIDARLPRGQLAITLMAN